MKTQITSLIAVLTIAFATPGMARQRIQVEAVNNDISYDLDLKAIASIFGDSRDLEDFERRINDADTQISNLDLNSDGDIDYLRVIETSEDNTHLVVIQAILDKDVFQDVATIVVDRDRYSRSFVQVIGDPYIYGPNYIIEPVFYRTPRILSWFWTPFYRSWTSPYYWGYYPRYYSYRRPLAINIYLSHIHGCINYDHHYRHSDNWRSPNAYRMYRSVSRSDYSERHPERSYHKRNSDFGNRYEMDKRYNRDYVKPTERRSYGEGYRTSSNRSSNDDVYSRPTRTTNESRDSYGTHTERSSRVYESTRTARPEVSRPVDITPRSNGGYTQRDNNSNQRTSTPSVSTTPSRRDVVRSSESSGNKVSRSSSEGRSNSSTRSNSDNNGRQGGRR